MIVLADTDEDGTFDSCLVFCIRDPCLIFQVIVFIWWALVVGPLSYLLLSSGCTFSPFLCFQLVAVKFSILKILHMKEVTNYTSLHSFTF